MGFRVSNKILFFIWKFEVVIRIVESVCEEWMKSCIGNDSLVFIFDKCLIRDVIILFFF